MGSNYSRAKPVAKGKTSRDYHRVITADAILGVPNKVRLDAYYIVKEKQLSQFLLPLIRNKSLQALVLISSDWPVLPYITTQTANVLFLSSVDSEKTIHGSYCSSRHHDKEHGYDRP
jgi:hypothetical protein